MELKEKKKKGKKCPGPVKKKKKKTRQVNLFVKNDSLIFLFFFFTWVVKCRRNELIYASRAPLAERSAVNRQVLGSIPSGGVRLFFQVFPRTSHRSISAAQRYCHTIIPG